MLKVLKIGHISTRTYDCIIAHRMQALHASKACKRAIGCLNRRDFQCTGHDKGGKARTEVVCSHHDTIFVLDGEDGGASDYGLSGRRLGMRKPGIVRKERTVCVAQHHWMRSTRLARGCGKDRLRGSRTCHISTKAFVTSAWNKILASSDSLDDPSWLESDP